MNIFLHFIYFFELFFFDERFLTKLFQLMLLIEKSPLNDLAICECCTSVHVIEIKYYGIYSLLQLFQSKQKTMTEFLENLNRKIAKENPDLMDWCFVQKNLHSGKCCPLEEIKPSVSRTYYTSMTNKAAQQMEPSNYEKTEYLYNKHYIHVYIYIYIYIYVHISGDFATRKFTVLLGP